MFFGGDNTCISIRGHLIKWLKCFDNQNDCVWVFLNMPPLIKNLGSQSIVRPKVIVRQKSKTFC